MASARRTTPSSPNCFVRSHKGRYLTRKGLSRKPRGVGPGSVCSGRSQIDDRVIWRVVPAPLAGDKSAIGVQHGASDVARRIRREEKGRPHHFVGVRHPSEQARTGHAGGGCWSSGACHVGVNRSWSKSIYPNAFRRQGSGQRLGIRDHCCLGGGVMRDRGREEPGSGRNHVDHRRMIRDA